MSQSTDPSYDTLAYHEISRQLALIMTKSSGMYTFYSSLDASFLHVVPSGLDPTLNTRSLFLYSSITLILITHALFPSSPVSLIRRVFIEFSFRYRCLFVSIVVHRLFPFGIVVFERRKTASDGYRPREASVDTAVGRLRIISILSLEGRQSVFRLCQRQSGQWRRVSDMDRRQRTSDSLG